MQPYEIIAAPYTLWLAPVGTAFPDTVTTPPIAWIKVGTSGTKNYSEDGVTVVHGQKIDTFTPVGSTAPRKAWRSEETLEIDVKLVDLSPAQYAQALNNATVTTAAGPPAEKHFSLLQGLTVATFALLVRGASPVLETVNAQYEVPIVYQGENPSPVFKKGTPAQLALKFMALEDDTLGFGVLRMQTA